MNGDDKTLIIELRTSMGVSKYGVAGLSPCEECPDRDLSMLLGI